MRDKLPQLPTQQIWPAQPSCFHRRRGAGAAWLPSPPKHRRRASTSLRLLTGQLAFPPVDSAEGDQSSHHRIEQLSMTISAKVSAPSSRASSGSSLWREPCSQCSGWRRRSWLQTQTLHRKILTFSIHCEAAKGQVKWSKRKRRERRNLTSGFHSEIK